MGAWEKQELAEALEFWPRRKKTPASGSWRHGRERKMVNPQINDIDPVC
jgi:hypothetical protein